jgi:alpha-L-fucosidase
MKSLKECLQTLVLCAGGDGNLLFNVGPMPDGRIEPRQVERWKEMGAWLAKNGESIHGTRGGPWKPSKAAASTRKGNTVFLHVFRWEGDAIALPDVPRAVKQAALLDGRKVEFRQAGGKLTLKVPAMDRDAIDTVIRLELDQSAVDLPLLAVASSVKATASNVYQNQIHEYGPEMAFDGDSGSRWATDSGVRQAWITGDLGRTLTIQRVRIEEALAERVQKFEFQYRDGTDWKTVFAGGRIGEWFQKKFEQPVTAQEFRLNILDATDGPTISELEFFEK